jgi:hypothetical protein
MPAGRLLVTGVGRQSGARETPCSSSTELPRLDLHLQQLDSVFLLEDRSLLHLEFQDGYLWEDLIRFAEYDLELHRQHRCDVISVIF